MDEVPIITWEVWVVGGVNGESNGKSNGTAEKEKEKEKESKNDDKEEQKQVIEVKMAPTNANGIQKPSTDASAQCFSFLMLGMASCAPQCLFNTVHKWPVNFFGKGPLWNC